jgi:hypothetical protein
VDGDVQAHVLPTRPAAKGNGEVVVRPGTSAVEEDCSAADDWLEGVLLDVRNGMSS